MLPKEKLAEFCRRNHVLELSLFGSVLREDFGPDSDVLVVFEEGHTPGFFGLARMEEELSGLLGGRKVDAAGSGFRHRKRAPGLNTDRMLALALVRSIEIIGEARVSAEGRARVPDIPWVEIIAGRNRLIHACSSWT